MRWARAGGAFVGVLLTLASAACSAFDPNVGPLRSQPTGCGASAPAPTGGVGGYDRPAADADAGADAGSGCGAS